MRSESTGSTQTLFRLDSFFRLLLAVVSVFVLSYLAARLGGLLVLRPQMIWPLWPGCAFLVAVLVLTQQKTLWPILLAAGLGGFALYDLSAGLSIRSIGLFLLADGIEVLVASFGVRFVFRGVPRLNNARSLAIYCLFAVIPAPILVATIAASATGASSWLAWRVSFFTEALALLTITPAIWRWTDVAIAGVRKPRAYYLEAMAMLAGLLTLSYFAFVAGGTGNRPALLYSLVPFLLWCALRFGVTGVSSSMIVVGFLSILGTIHGRGPFLGNTPIGNVLSLQLFLLFAIASFMLLAVTAEEQKQAQERSQESEERFRLVADTAPVLIWMSGIDKLCNYFNKPWLEFTGRSFEAESGNGWAQGVHPDDVQRCMDVYTRAFDRREEFRMTYRLRRNDGEYRWILDVGVPRFDQRGIFLGYIGIGLDETERKLAEDARSRYAAIVESSDDAIMGVDRNGTITHWNKGAEQLYGYSASEAIGKDITFLQPVDPSESRQILARVLDGRQLREYETVRQRKDGTRVTVALTISPILDSEGQVTGKSAIARDITERKRAEEVLSGMSRRLIEAQEQERTRIARELHDDINQRLALLAVELEQARENPAESEPRMLELQRKIHEIATDVQALSHELHSAKLEYLGAVSGMRSWCREFAERRKMEIEFKSSEGLSSVSSDIGLCLFRVLQEALHNAARHSGAGRVEVQLWEQASEIHLVINDQGRGFEIERAMQGKGLGLTSMQERVRLMKGNIHIRSTPMAGTTIHVQLPFVPEQVSRRAAG
jgi:PAS domain S-box-containing protein